LENPLDSKAAEKVLKDVSQDFELEAAFKKLQQETAKDIAEGNVPARLKVFKDSGGNLFYKRGPKRTELADKALAAHRVAKGA
jgi:hypothetical protein